MLTRRFMITSSQRSLSPRCQWIQQARSSFLELCANQSRKNNYRTTTARLQNHGRKRVIVGTTKSPSLDNSPNKRYPLSRSFRKRMKQLQSLWLKPGSQKLSCKGKKKSQFMKGQAENHLYSGNLLCGQSWLIGYQQECVSCINVTWNILQREILCLLLALKIDISIGGWTTYGSNLKICGIYTIKTLLTSPSSVHFACKCFLSHFYSSTKFVLSHPVLLFLIV